MNYGSGAYPFARPLYVMLKPAGAACNLRCSYCYYLDKKELYPDRHQYLMTDEVLEEFTRQYLEAQTMPQVLFTWHGGEPLLRDIGFYRKALRFQQIYGRGRPIGNTLQTNGVLLTDEWCKFFRDNNFLIGISIDGPAHCHDRYRLTADGKPSFEHVLRGIELLKKYGVDYNVMGVVNDYNADYPLEFYRFFKRIDARYIQFSPIVERMPDGQLAPWNVSAEKWGDFLVAVFDEWVRKDVGEFYVQYFDSALANWVGENPGICLFARSCGHAGVMEFNGDVYSCDHFVSPQHKLGNIHSDTLIGMMYSDKQSKFGAGKYETLPDYCRRCEFLFACHGECPKNRIVDSPDGETGLNYLCKGYYKFFKHAAPYMEFMKRELQNGQAPSNVMTAIKNRKL